MPSSTRLVAMKALTIRTIGRSSGKSKRARSAAPGRKRARSRSEEHTSELQSLMRISYAVFCLKKKKTKTNDKHINQYISIQNHTIRNIETMKKCQLRQHYSL